MIEVRCHHAADFNRPPSNVIVFQTSHGEASREEFAKSGWTGRAVVLVRLEMS
jgi:hypothetical protein